METLNYAALDPSNITGSKLTLGLELGLLGIGEVDFVNNTITLDKRAAELFELPEGEPISRTVFHTRIYPDDQFAIMSKVDDLLNTNKENVIDVQHRVQRSDGEIIWVRARKKVAFAPEGYDGLAAPQTGLVAIQDITAVKKSEADIRDLMKELNHRSKNMLAVVQSIARMTERANMPETFMERFSARLNALAANQDILVNNHWADININELIDAHLIPFVSLDHNRIHKKGPNVQLNAKAGQALGLALHELATNAVKYGALSNAHGTIEIDWGIAEAENPTFVICWSELGGPPVVSPTRKGFGERVLTSMASTGVGGSATIDYKTSGIEWVLTAPVDSALADLPNYSRF